jgi:ferredoxin
MKVWIDQNLCSGSGLCEDTLPEVFTIIDGLAYINSDLILVGSAHVVPRALWRDTRKAVKECPTECIFITEGEE